MIRTRFRICGATILSLATALPTATYAQGRPVEPVRAGQIGVASGDSTREFFRIADVDFLSDSTVAVASSSADIRVFHINGNILNRWGRRGSGPTEFKSIDPGGVYFSRDSLWIFDSLLQRVSVWTPNGKFGRTIPLVGLSGGPYYVLGVFSDGSMLLRKTVGIPPAIKAGWLTADVDIFRSNPSVTRAVLLGRVFWKTHFLAFQSANGVKGWATWDPPGAIHASVQVHQDAFWYADARRAVIEKYGNSLASVVEMVSLPTGPARVDHQHLARAQRNWFAGLDPFLQSRLGDALSSMYESAIPPRGATALLADPNGSLWYTQNYYSESGPVTWRSEREKGERKAVLLPREFRLTSVRGRLLVGIFTDEDGVEYVRFYKID